MQKSKKRFTTDSYTFDLALCLYFLLANTATFLHLGPALRLDLAKTVFSLLSQITLNT